MMFLSKKIFFYILGILIFFTFYLLIINKQGFGDAFENIVGGWLITKGYVLYKDQFVPRAPFLYYYAALIHYLVGKNIIYFRIGLFLFYLFFSFLLFKVSESKIKKSLSIFLILFSLGGFIFHHHMFLADNFIAFSLLSIYILFFQQGSETDFTLNKKIILSFSIFIALNSSLITAIPLITFLTFYLLKRLLFKNKNIKNVLASFFILTVPNLIFPFYFYFKKNLTDFLWAMFSFSQYYFLYRIGEPHEVRYGKLGFIYRVISNFVEYVGGMFSNLTFTLFKFFQSSRFFIPYFFYKTQNFISLTDFLEKYLAYIWLILTELVKGLFSLEAVIFIIYLFFLALLLIKKRYFFTIFTIFYMIGLRLRTNEIFHLAPFYLMAFWMISYLISFFISERHKFKKKGTLAIFNNVGLLLSLILFTVFLINIIPGYIQVVKQNEPIIAEKILESTTKIKINSQEKDKVWVVDSNPIYYMLSNRSPAIKYYFYFPYFFKVDKIRMEVDKDLKTNIPKLIFIPEYNYFLKSKDYNIAREILTKLEDNYFINNGTYLLR